MHPLEALHRSLCIFRDYEENLRSPVKDSFASSSPATSLKSNPRFFLHIHLGVALAYTHDSAATHALHGKVHNEQQEQKWKCIT